MNQRTKDLLIMIALPSLYIIVFLLLILWATRADPNPYVPVVTDTYRLPVPSDRVVCPDC